MTGYSAEVKGYRYFRELLAEERRRQIVLTYLYYTELFSHRNK